MSKSGRAAKKAARVCSDPLKGIRRLDMIEEKMGSDWVDATDRCVYISELFAICSRFFKERRVDLLRSFESHNIMRKFNGRQNLNKVTAYLRMVKMMMSCVVNKGTITKSGNCLSRSKRHARQTAIFRRHINKIREYKEKRPQMGILQWPRTVSIIVRGRWYGV